MISVQTDSPMRADVQLLLDEHLSDMYATSPADSVHALDHSGLADADITFYTAREHGFLVGCGALKHLSDDEAEIKSMRTAAPARRRGVANLLLAWIIDEARTRGYERLSLETGTVDYFAAARRLYQRHGFEECAPFGTYASDPYSTFMSLALSPSISLKAAGSS
jgi:putative acetyltransferase